MLKVEKNYWMDKGITAFFEGHCKFFFFHLYLSIIYLYKHMLVDSGNLWFFRQEVCADKREKKEAPLRNDGDIDEVD